MEIERGRVEDAGEISYPGDVNGRSTMLSEMIARQLANPSRLAGRFILGPLWNRRNSILNDVAHEALSLTPADRVLEVGFGGGASSGA